MTKQDPIFNDENRVKSQFITWGKIGDWFKGTFLNVRDVPSTIKMGELNKVYEFRAHAGEFHDLDENKQPLAEATTINENDIWSVGGRASIDNQMKNIKPGTIIGMRFVEVKPAKTKGYNPAKIVHVYVGGRDPQYMGENVDNIDFTK